MSAPRCPFCTSPATKRVGLWGGQIITAQWQCERCGSYFEAVRSELYDEPEPGADPEPGGAPAAITIRRRIEWIDTDAAGIYHWTTAGRLVEAAEAELHRALGISELTFGASPRVAVSFKFKRRLRFDDPVDVELRVARVGRSSIAYEVELVGPAGTAARGSLVTCIVDRESGKPTPLPERLRTALTSAGTQRATEEYRDSP